jgi:predicted HicB family RNase H-like nuclease
MAEPRNLPAHYSGHAGYVGIAVDAVKGDVALGDDVEEAGILYGEVINVRDVITFEGESVDEIQKAFRESVDDYLDFCAQRGESPEKPFSGKFVVRLPAELHREAYIQPKLKDQSLNRWVTEVLQRALRDQ